VKLRGLKSTIDLANVKVITQAEMVSSEAGICRLILEIFQA
jgi:hypothetical protein